MNHLRRAEVGLSCYFIFHFPQLAHQPLPFEPHLPGSSAPAEVPSRRETPTRIIDQGIFITHSGTRIHPNSPEWCAWTHLVIRSKTLTQTQSHQGKIFGLLKTNIIHTCHSSFRKTGKNTNINNFMYIYNFESTPHPVIVTTRILIFFGSGIPMNLTGWKGIDPQLQPF